MAEGYEVYKVVRRKIDNQLISCFTPEELQVYYKVGEKSFPKVGKLFCFKNLSSARSFIKERCTISINTIILLCETNSVSFLKDIKNIPVGSSRTEWAHSYIYFWRSPQIWVESHLGDSIPKGTVFCDYVIPLEEVR